MNNLNKKIMIYTRKWVEENYNKYNDLIWGGKLPAFNKLEFNIIMTKKTWGRAGCKNWTFDENGLPKPIQPILELSNYLDAPEWAKLNTLVHEMCHLYEFFCEPRYLIEAKRRGRATADYPKNGHGTIFYEQAARVKSLTGLEITRYVDEVRANSASLSDDTRKKAERKINRLGGVNIYVMKLTRKGSKGKGDYGIAKVENPAINEKWEDFLVKRQAHAKTYCTSAILCKSFSPETLQLSSSKSVSWYIKNDFSALKEKYGLQLEKVFFGNVDEFDFNEEANTTQEEPVINNITDDKGEKRYREFNLKFTNGNTLRLTNVTKMEVESKLREKFPKWPDSTIERFVQNDKLYTESNKLDYIVEKVLREKLNKHMNNNIKPLSPEEMEKFSGAFIVNN
jgi:hypothetical protein